MNPSPSRPTPDSPGSPASPAGSPPPIQTKVQTRTETDWEIKRDREHTLGITKEKSNEFTIYQKESARTTYFLDLTREDLINLRHLINAALS